MTQGITFLGTGGDSTVVGRQLRASGGIIISYEDSQIHLDPGPGTLVQMKNFGFHPRETTCLLLSHQHINHAGDASALISAMTHNGVDRRGVLISNPASSIIPQTIQQFTEKVVTLSHDQRIGINNIEIRAIGLEHYDSECNGYIISTPEYVIGYISDTLMTEKLHYHFKECNILIINTRFPDDAVEGDHLCTKDVIDLLRSLKPQLVVITHFGAKFHDPLQQARTIQQETKIQTVAAKDGLVIAPSSYSAKKKQHTLRQY